MGETLRPILRGNEEESTDTPIFVNRKELKVGVVRLEMETTICRKRRDLETKEKNIAVSIT